MMLLLEGLTDSFIPALVFFSLTFTMIVITTGGPEKEGGRERGNGEREGKRECILSKE